MPAASATVDVLVALLTAQRGDRYVFGAEASFSDPNPARWDCSELIEWGCHRVGVSPVMPDGASAQWRHCSEHGTVLVGTPAEVPRGGLLFRIGVHGDHVAMALGNGRTIEARGSQFGVNTFPVANRLWTGAALIPGLSYTRAALPTSTGSWYHRLLSLGSAGADVAHVQARLQNVKVDGDYGPKTRAAVILFQRHHAGLTVDGVVGPRTAAMIG